MSKRTRDRVGVAVAVALYGAAAVRVGPALAADESSSNALEEVIVTARKRSENLQDVPQSIDVLTDKDLRHLGIRSFDDYAEKVPSISFISAGPGSQQLIMRGVSDGSNPNYSNTSSTGIFLDDVSLSLQGSQPDLHLYDIERIEVLNGPQGTTFGAGSMAGAVRYITHKPDLRAFSAGADFDGGKISGGQSNWTYEGFLNLPLIQDVLGLRMSAFSASHGGFIDNKPVTRQWVNGTVSNNSQWARNNYNHEHEEGGRIALTGSLDDRLSATLTYTYQRQSILGAWDEDVPHYGPRAVARFGPEQNLMEDRILDFHVDADVGIGDLVFASTYWSLPKRGWNEYSEYMQNFDGGAKQSFACLDDPTHGAGYAGCNVPTLAIASQQNPERWSDELRLASKPGGRLHWLAGLYWEKTRDKASGSTFHMPGLQTEGSAFQYYAAMYGTTVSSLPPGVWYSATTRSDYLQTTEFANINFDVTQRLQVEAGVVHFHSGFHDYSPYGQFAYMPTEPSDSRGSSHKWNSKFGVDYKILDHLMVYADFAQGFRDGGVNSGFPDSCYNNGVSKTYVPDTLNNYEIGWKSTSLGGRLVFNGALYWMDWSNLQTLIYDVDACPSSSFNANVGKARIYGAESTVDFRLSDNWSLQANASYTDSHLVSSQYTSFEANVGERLPYVPYFSYSWNVRYDHPIGKALSGYAQLDLAHKGDMWNDLHVAGSNGFPRMLQPSYSIMNLRLGLNPLDGRWMLEAYVTNLTDKNAIIYTNTGNFDLRQTTSEPRVIGMRVNYRFGKETNAE